MAQQLVEAGHAEDGTPFVIVEEGLYPNIHRQRYNGDLIPAKFLKEFEKKEEEVTEEEVTEEDKPVESDPVMDLLSDDTSAKKG